MMQPITPRVRTNREIWGVPFIMGAEWDAGGDPPQAMNPGRWTVRRTADGFLVLFIRFETRAETILETYPDTELGELDAKTHAIVAQRHGEKLPKIDPCS